ncbi:MAG: N-acetylmuramoyl-L-alanine amidase [Pseudonocardiaceae bacterium]
MAKPSKYVSRAGWGARPRGATPSTHPIGSTSGVTLHWEGPHMGSFAHSQCDNKVRSIEAFHRDTRDWADIAYNALVCPHGYVYEGRGVNTMSAANGNSTTNGAWYAVCYLGGERDPFTTDAKKAFVEAVQWLRSEGNAGSRVNGHRDHKATACPGDTIYAWLKAANFNADPTPAPAPKPEVPAVTWKTPIDKDPRPKAGAVTLQTVTANVRELPRHDDTIKTTFDRAATGCQLAGFQETGNDVYVRAMRAALENHGCHGLSGDPQHNVSMAYDKKLFRHVDSDYWKLFDGESGIGHTRHGLWVELEMLADPTFHVIVTSVHYPSGGFSPSGAPRTSGDRIAKRVQMWHEANSNDRQMLATLAKKGHPMVVFGDFNRQKVKPYADVEAGRKTHAISSALDWTIYFDGADAAWTTHEANKVSIGSDHPALQNRATLRFS